MFFKLTLLSLLAALTHGENIRGILNPFHRIVNGTTVDIKDVPYYVSIFQPPTWNHYCGGSILSYRFVLSAGHCFSGKQSEASTWKVRSGSNLVSRGGRVTNVQQFIVHPEYSSETQNNDFCLVRLKSSLSFNDATKVIKLADTSNCLFEGRKVMITGHGETKNEQQDNEYLWGAVVKLENFDTCNKAYGNALTTNMICANTDTRQDTCQGDSGGPLECLSDGTLVGVVSFGQGCADPNFPGVYSKVPAVTEWIKTNAKLK